MTQVSDHIRDNVYAVVSADLKPSRWLVHGKIGFAISLGGLTSLFLCGQLGVELTSLASHVHAWMMETAGFLGCTTLCGILFAIIPVVTLRVTSTALQFQVLVRKEWTASAGWIMAFGSLIVFMNDRADPLWVLLLWGLAAIASFGALSRLVHRASVRLSSYSLAH